MSSFKKNRKFVPNTSPLMLFNYRHAHVKVAPNALSLLCWDK